MKCKAVDSNNMMGGTAFRVEQLKIRTSVFQFLGLLPTPYNLCVCNAISHLNVLSVLNVKAQVVVGPFNQEKALIRAFSMIVNETTIFMKVCLQL